MAGPVSNRVCGTGELIIEVSNVRLSAFANNGVEEHSITTTGSEWIPHIETEAPSTLVKPSRENQIHAVTLNESVNVLIATSRRSTTGLNIIPEPQRYKIWCDENSPSSEKLDDATLSARIESLATTLASTPTASIAKAITLVTDNAPEMLFEKPFRSLRYRRRPPED